MTIPLNLTATLTAWRGRTITVAFDHERITGVLVDLIHEDDKLAALYIRTEGRRTGQPDAFRIVPILAGQICYLQTIDQYRTAPVSPDTNPRLPETQPRPGTLLAALEDIVAVRGATPAQVQAWADDTNPVGRMYGLDPRGIDPNR